MCILNEDSNVTATKIFVAPDKTKTKQLTVYSNQVGSESNNNMMILPVPYPNTVKFK